MECTVQCTLYTIQYTMYRINYAQYSIQSAMCSHSGYGTYNLWYMELPQILRTLRLSHILQIYIGTTVKHENNKEFEKGNESHTSFSRHVLSSMVQEPYFCSCSRLPFNLRML